MDFNGCLPSLACPNICIAPNQTCNNFTCQCSTGYYVDEITNRCLKTGGTTPISACDSSPCFHSGTCVVNGNGFTCQCVAGYIGMWQLGLRLICLGNPLRWQIDIYKRLTSKRDEISPLLSRLIFQRGLKTPL